MASIRLPELTLALLLAAPGVATAQARTIFCCDIGGQPVCGDILPAACYGRGYREIGPQGTLLRYVPPPMTAEEAARHEQEERRRKEAEAVALRQRRLDRALLDTYPSEEVLIARRDRALADMDRTIADLRVREKGLLERKARLSQETEFYRGQQLPADLAEDLHNIEGEITAQRSVIDAKMREREAVKSRFEEDRSRYRELTAPSNARRR